MNNSYVHYGSTGFYPELIGRAPRPDLVTGKPMNALFGSRVDAVYSWKEWNERSEYTECREDNCFRFRVRDESRILRITSVNQVDELPTMEDLPGWVNPKLIPIVDWGQIAARGYDGVEVLVSEDLRLLCRWPVWDCDTIAIWNREAVIVED